MKKVVHIVKNLPLWVLSLLFAGEATSNVAIKPDISLEKRISVVRAQLKSDFVKGNAKNIGIKFQKYANKTSWGNWLNWGNWSNWNNWNNWVKWNDWNNWNNWNDFSNWQKFSNF